ncbi:MAG: lysine-2,3-aminomutase-like protein [Beijerinckiaceae bacterium]|jgi:lysine 2,3-aminomutase|nr:lysine-2,3-aminomutase-like protein [Beijerinckiaceae bacterium]
MSKDESAAGQNGYFRSPAELSAAGLLSADSIPSMEAVTSRYAVSISSVLAGLVDPSDPADPIARQFVPDVRELETSAGELADPIGDLVHQPVPGIVHRYPDRVLLQALKICPVYCRFCFRRETVGPGAGQMLSEVELDGACAYIAADKAIWEVILTGGDPLAMSPRRMQALMRRLAAIDHVKIVRLHTRVPAADPSRVTQELLDALKACGKTVYMALHANHPRELTGTARAACARIVDSGIPMISQTVLLKGVNDDAGTLADLMRCFVENRIKPYYLHHPDLAPGTGHFRLTIEEGQKLVRQLRGRLSGLAQPEYVIDIPGGFGKSPAAAPYITRADRAIAQTADGKAAYSVVDWRGATHAYDDTLPGDSPELDKAVTGQKRG